MRKNHQFTRAFIILTLAFFLCLFACRRDPEIVNVKSLTLAQLSSGYSNTPYTIKTPRLFPQPYIPIDNPMTVEGVTLGRYLFYDSILSGNYKQSCGSCHLQKFAFSNGNIQFSLGGPNMLSPGNRNAPALFNKAWDIEGMPPYGGFFWDGRAKSLEDQALMPLLNPIEMNIGDINIAVQRLQKSPMYPALFQKAFGSNVVVKENIAKAIAQFVRTIVSGNSLYDSMKNYGSAVFNANQNAGYTLVEGGDPTFIKNNIDRDPGTALDCIHCHRAPLFTPDPSLHPFMNNGFTGSDGNGNLITLFKVPSLRNIMLTMPYMNDGQLANIDSVIAHYDHGNSAINSPYLSDFMFYKRFTKKVKMNLSANEISQIKEFLSTLTDNTLVTNPAYKNPFLK